jgi:hypothetical protein
VGRPTQTFGNRLSRPPLPAYLALAGSTALVGRDVGLSKLLIAAFPAVHAA